MPQLSDKLIITLTSLRSYTFVLIEIKFLVMMNLFESAGAENLSSIASSSSIWPKLNAFALIIPHHKLSTMVLESLFLLSRFSSLV